MELEDKKESKRKRDGEDELKSIKVFKRDDGSGKRIEEESATSQQANKTQEAFFKRMVSVENSHIWMILRKL